MAMGIDRRPGSMSGDARRFTLPALLYLVTLSLTSSCRCQEGAMHLQGPLDVSRIGLEQREPMLAVVKGASAPKDYLLEKFRAHDVVILGEVHQIRQNCDFVSELIPRLYARAGVRCLATEFLRSVHTARVRKLLRAKIFDKDAMAEVFRDLPWPTWGFREYRDILEAVWKLNRSLPAGAEVMDVLGLDSDWSQHQSWFGSMTRQDHMQMLLAREQNMIAVVEEGVLARKRKALVHVGFAHSVTCQGVRLATVLRKKHGRRIFQVGLHQRLSGRLTPFLERLFLEAGGEPRGFDAIGSALGRLTDAENPQLKLLRPPTLASLCEGYVYLAPAAMLEKVSWIPGHINASNYAQALDVAVRMKWAEADRCRTPEALDRRLQEIFKPR